MRYTDRAQSRLAQRTDSQWDTLRQWITHDVPSFSSWFDWSRGRRVYWVFIRSFPINGGVFDASDATVFTVNDNFTLQNGAVFTAPGGTMTVDNDFSNSGTFNADGGTVELVGDLTQAIIGSTTFYNLVKTLAGSVEFQCGFHTNYCG